MKIIYIRDSKSRGYLTLGILSGDEKISLTVSELCYVDLGSFAVGDEVSEADFKSLLTDDERYRATLSALKILSYADNNRKNLYRKLISKGFSREIAGEVLSDMVGRGYIDEDRQLEALIIREVNTSLIGPRKLFAKLTAKGYSSSDTIRKTEELTERGEIDFSKTKARLLEKKLTRDATDEEKKKLLYKFGYDIC